MNKNKELFDQIKPGSIVTGPMFSESVQVIVTIPMGESIKLVGKGLKTGKVHEPILDTEQLSKIQVTPEKEPFDGDVKSLEEAMRRHEAPFYLRRVKEVLLSFPDSDTGEVKMLFTKRNVQTSEFQIDDDEWSFYDALTRYVEDQSIKAAEDDSARGRALGFTMAMLQRRFASSIAFH